MQALDALDFSIDYYPSYKVVTNRQSGTPYYSVLYPCGTEPPAEDEVEGLAADNAGVAFFAIPLTAVATDDSTAGWAIVRSQCRFLCTFAG